MFYFEASIFKALLSKHKKMSKISFACIKNILLSKTNYKCANFS